MMPEEIQSPISIHALREEGDRNAKGQQTVHFIFLSTPSARRATDYYVPQFANLGISIHALREEGDWYVIVQPVLSTPISIHALREEGDAAAQAEQDKLKAEISIHALREEGDQQTLDYVQSLYEFLSTPSARRATRKCSGGVPLTLDFYPRPPRGGRRICNSILQRL